MIKRSANRPSVLVFLAGLVLSPVRPVDAARVPTLSPDDLRPGQKAEVLTVFKGHAIESFEAEIIGVLRGGTGGDLILAIGTGENVRRTGVAQGMSGSPVYVEGKLIGALSSGWPFSREPVFGITPIEEMLDVLELPPVAPDGPAVGPAGAGSRMARRPTFRGLTWERRGSTVASGGPPGSAPGAMDGMDGPVPEAWATHGVPLAPAGPPARLPLPLSCSGLHADAYVAARDWLAPFHMNVLPGGTQPAPQGRRGIEPGSAVAVDVLRGDLQLSAIGTATWVDGDRVLLFGHPFFQAGDVRMPLSSAEVTTIVASGLNSFKLGVTAEPAGVVEQDRRAAVSGRLGPSPRMLPVSVVVRGERARPQTFRFESIEDRTLAPTLIAIATLSSLLESGGAGGNRTMHWRLGIHRAGRAPLQIEDVTAGEAPPNEVALDLSAPLALLFDNPYERLDLDSITIAVDVERAKDAWTLVDVTLDRSEVRPGEPVRLRCLLERWRGGRETRDLTVRIPEELAPGRYQLRVAGAADLTRYERQVHPERFRPESLDDAWMRLATSRSTNAVYAALVGPGTEVTRDGQDYGALPPSVLSVLRDPGERPTTRGSRGVAWFTEERMPIEGTVAGGRVLPLSVSVRTR